MFILLFVISQLIIFVFSSRMSPTDFTDSHRLLVCVCFNLLGFHRFSILWWNFRICVNLCNLWEYYIFVYSVRYYVSLVNYILPQISQIVTDCWRAFVLIFYDFTYSVFLGGFPYLCKSVQSVGAFVVCNLWELFCRMQLVGETLYLEYPFILRCISLFILSVLKLTSIPKCKLHKRR